MAHKILIVDDSPTARRFVRNELQKLGYEVFEAIDGTDALELLKNLSPALVISDVNMAPMDGLTFVAQLRKQFTRSQLPVLMLTTEAGDDMKIRGRAVGASGWLVKPFDPTHMSAVVAHVLATPERAAAPGSTP